MKICTNISVFLFILEILSSCNSETQVQEAENPSLEHIAGYYTLHVTRIAEHPAVQFPSDTLTENLYHLDSSGKKYQILFSPNGSQIFIQRDSIIGYKSYHSNKLIKYDLVEGLDAGGRFIVWIYGKLLEAELTIYGSGVPILMSARGMLVKDNI